MVLGGMIMEIPAQALLIKKIYDNSYDYLRKNMV